MYADIIDNFSAPLVTSISDSDSDLVIGSSAFTALFTKLTNIIEDDGEAGVFHPYSGPTSQFFTLDDGTNVEVVEVTAYDTNTEIITVSRGGTAFAFASGTLFAARPNAKTLESVHESATIQAAIDRLTINYETDVNFSAADYAGVGSAAITVTGTDDIECTLSDFEEQLLRSRIAHEAVSFEFTVYLLGTGSVTFVTSDSTISAPGGLTKLDTQFGRVKAVWIPPSQLATAVGRWILDANVTLVAP